MELIDNIQKSFAEAGTGTAAQGDRTAGAKYTQRARTQ